MSDFELTTTKHFTTATCDMTILCILLHVFTAVQLLTNFNVKSNYELYNK